MLRTVFPACLTLVALALATVAQPPRLTETGEPPLAKDLPDSMIRQASAQFQARPTAPVTGNTYTTPNVTVTVIAPQTIPNGQDIDYKLRVVNVSGLQASGVVVIHPMPKGGTFKRSDIPPTSADPDGTRYWEIGTLPPGAVKEINVTVTPAAEMTEWHHVVRVRFEHGRQATTRIARPELSVKLQTPSVVQQHDESFLRIEVRNPGLLELRDVQVTLAVPDGVRHKYDPTSPGTTPQAANSPQMRTWTIPRLGPNEVRFIDSRVAADKGGSHALLATAVAANGIKATEAKGTLTVQPPKLELSASGPTRRGSHETANYRLIVRNGGNAVLRNVTLSDKLPAGCEIVSLSGGGQMFDRDIQWIIPQLAPGEQRSFELTTKATGPGRHQHAFAVSWQSLRDEKVVVTEFDALAALRMTVRPEPDTTTVGQTVRLVVSVENFGSAAASNVRPAIVLPPSLTYVQADPPEHRHEGGRVSFAPASIAAHGKQVFTVTARAAKAALPAVFTAELAADQLESGAIRQQESVSIGDATRPPPR